MSRDGPVFCWKTQKFTIITKLKQLFHGLFYLNIQSVNPVFWNIMNKKNYPCGTCVIIRKYNQNNTKCFEWKYTWWTYFAFYLSHVWKGNFIELSMSYLFESYSLSVWFFMNLFSNSYVKCRRSPNSDKVYYFRLCDIVVELDIDLFW